MNFFSPEVRQAPDARELQGCFSAKFVRHACELDLKPSLANSGRAGSVHVTFHDNSYLIIAELAEQQVAFSCISNVKFPPEQLPPSIDRLLAEMDRRIDYGEWHSMDMEDFSFYMLQGKYDLRHFDLDLLRFVITRYTPTVAALDCRLTELGYP